MFDCPSSLDSHEQAPRQPKRRKSLSSSHDEEDEFDLEALIKMQPRRESNCVTMSSDSFSFLSCSMLSLQTEDSFDVSRGSIDRSSSLEDSITLTPLKADGPNTPQGNSHPHAAPRGRGLLRRCRGVIMPSTGHRNHRAPRRQLTRSDHNSFRSLERHPTMTYSNEF